MIRVSADFVCVCGYVLPNFKYRNCFVLESNAETKTGEKCHFVCKRNAFTKDAPFCIPWCIEEGRPICCAVSVSFFWKCFDRAYHLKIWQGFWVGNVKPCWWLVNLSGLVDSTSRWNTQTFWLSTLAHRTHCIWELLEKDKRKTNVYPFFSRFVPVWRGLMTWLKWELFMATSLETYNFM